MERTCKRSLRFVGRVFLTLCLLTNSSFAYPSWQQNTAQPQTNISNPTNTNKTTDTPPSDAFSINSSQFGWAGPLSFGVNRDSLLNYSWNAQYTQKFNDNFALSGLVEYGSNTFRLNGTMGFNLFQKGLLKVTAERLAQVLPFNFDSGSVNQKMFQNAAGARYQYGFNSNFFQDINFGGYYANTPSKWLDPVQFLFQGANAINYRHIAGGKSTGFDVGTDIKLTKMTGLAGHVYYDAVNYNTVFDNTPSSDTKGIGGGVTLNQLLGKHILLAAEGSIRKIYDTYKLSASWLPPFASKFPFEVSLVGQRLLSHNQTPNSTSVGVKLTLNPSLLGGLDSHYELPNPTTINDIVSWTSVPAVHMDQVLAITDQKTVILAPAIVSINPAFASILGNVLITITGANFAGASAVTFDNVPALSFSIASPNTITCVAPPHLAGNVILAVTAPGGVAKANFTYSVISDTSPIITSVTPTSAPLSGEVAVTINGANYAKGAVVTFGDKTAKVKSVEKNKIIVTAPKWDGHAGKVDIMVTNPETNSMPAVSKNAFAYLDTKNQAPTITLISPNWSPTTGGGTATIYGTAFTNDAAVLFGSTPLSSGSYKVISDTEISIASIPAGAAGTIDVTVDTGAGGGIATAPFTYTSAEGPVVERVEPPSGPIFTPVTIFGRNFDPAGTCVVTFGTAQAPDCKVVSPQEIQTSSADGTGTVPVIVTINSLTSAINPSATFTYSQFAPIVSLVTPGGGPLAGGNHVTVQGNYFTGATNVTFNNKPAISFTVLAPTNIDAVVPDSSGVTGFVDVQVTTSAGASEINPGDRYYYSNGPLVTAVQPPQGMAGNTVTLVGNSFTGVSAVTFGGVNATQFTVVNDTQITATVPDQPTPPTQPVDVVVTKGSVQSPSITGDKFTYIVPPTVTGLSPPSGPAAGGNTVEISGTGFSSTTGVVFGNNPTQFIVLSDVLLQVTAPPQSSPENVVDVRVTNQAGQSPISQPADQYTYSNLPVITSLSPTGGTAGINVRIAGANLSTVTQVFFGTAPVNAMGYNPDGSLNVEVPTKASSDPNPVHVRAINSFGESAQTPNDLFTYSIPIPFPIITSFTPLSGPLGGTHVTITGENFASGATVTFANELASNVVVSQDGTTITCDSPTFNHPAEVTITVTNPDGLSGGSPEFFHYMNATLDPTNPIVPTQGPTSGGTTVTINGTNFPAGFTSVFFTLNGFYFGANNVSVISPTQITLTTPGVPAPGTADVKITLADGTNLTIPAGFTFTGNTSPFLQSVTPSVGPLEGQTKITISGINFVVPSTGNPGTQIKIDGTVVDACKVESSTTINCVTPKGPAVGYVPITATNPDGSTDTQENLFAYVSAPAPTIISVVPNSEPTTAGGNSITITGTNFAPGATVQLNNSALNVQVKNSTTITCTTPPSSSPGSVPVTVTNLDHQSAVLQNGYTYGDIIIPNIVSIAPQSGPLTGGTGVTITGNNFTDVTGVNFVERATGSSRPAASFYVNNLGQMYAVSPAGFSNVGAYDIEVVTSTGTSLHTDSDTFYYLATSPSVYSITPTSGDKATENRVQITGKNFLQTTTVHFGQAAAKIINVSTDGATIDCLTPIVSTAGPVDVSVSGQTPVILVNAFTFTNDNAPTVTSVTPDFGSTAGGDLVTVKGTNFITANGPVSVYFNGQQATSVNVIDTNTLTCITPAQSNGIVDVQVVTDNGTSPVSNGSKFTYYGSNAPVITQAINPISGPVTGGTTINVVGTGFAQTNGVTFDFGSVQVPAASVVINSDSSLTVVSPALPILPSASDKALADVIITTPNGTSAHGVYDQFFYTPLNIKATWGTNGKITAPGKTIDPVTGNVVVNYNTNQAFDIEANVGYQISSIQVDGSEISFTPGSSFIYTFNNVTSNQHTINATFKLLTPGIISISPTFGPLAGGTHIDIVGMNFVNDPSTTINVGSTTLRLTSGQCTFASGAEIDCITPPASIPGDVDVTVTTSGGTSNAKTFTYIAAPTVTQVNPNVGPTAGSTQVIITGTNFNGATAVNFGATSATSFNVDSATQITAVSPSGTGIVDVTVTTGGGTSPTSAADRFTYFSLPAVTSVSPTSGPETGGTQVTITGTNLAGATAVNFGGSPAISFQAISATQITAVSPAGTDTVDVRVTTPGGESAITAGDKFTYVPAPTVTAVNPKSGPESGGTSVIIIGTNFNGATAVKFGTTIATQFQVDSATQITATSPSVKASTVDITVTTVGGTSATSAADRFTFTPVTKPIVTNVNPNAGPTAGGTTVVITGDHYTAVSAVKFGAIDAASFTVDSQTQITAVSPAESASTVDITVTNPAGTSATSSADKFTFAPVPTITSLNPSSGPEAGGTLVTIVGTGFARATAVHFGSTTPSFTVVDASHITFTTPSGTGIVDVTVTTPGGTSNTKQFTYIPAPAVTNLNPTSGPEHGGTTVIITGSNFTGATAVKFGTTSATSFNVDSQTQITAVSPSGTSTVDVRVTTPGGVSAISTNDKFTYIPAPRIDLLSPNFGPEKGGTLVDMRGANFSKTGGLPTVLVGGKLATNVHFESSSDVDFITPAGTGTVDVTIINSDQQSFTAPKAFTYEPAPTISVVDPNHGPASGGSYVTVTGTNFRGGTQVSFGGLAATNVVIVSDTKVTCTTPKHPAGIVDVTVTNIDGQKATLTNGYTYDPAPTVTKAEPSHGPASGGTNVTVSGTNFVSGAHVSFGGVAATGVIVTSPTQLTCVSPAHNAGRVDVVVTNPDLQSGTLTNGYTYDPAPVVNLATPSHGPASGGTPVTISGENFVTGATVSFGGSNATNVHVDSPIQISCVTSAHLHGQVDVVVTNPDQQSGTLIGGYTFDAPPSVALVFPSSGSFNGGTPVSISGANFVAGAKVTFDTSEATNIQVVSPGLITCNTPAHAVGTVNVTVTNPDHQFGVKTDAYTYILTHTITATAGTGGAISPTGTVQVNDGSSISFSIRPNSNYNIKDVLVDGVSVGAVSTYTFSNVHADHTIAASFVLKPVPPTPTPVTTAFKATNNPLLNAGFMDSAGVRIVQASLPSLINLSINKGSAEGGDRVILTFSNFKKPPKKVTFGGVPAKIISATRGKVIVETPAHSGGNVDVVISNANESVKQADAFSYYEEE